MSTFLGLAISLQVIGFIIFPVIYARNLGIILASFLLPFHKSSGLIDFFSSLNIFWVESSFFILAAFVPCYVLCEDSLISLYLLPVSPKQSIASTPGVQAGSIQTGFIQQLSFCCNFFSRCLVVFYCQSLIFF